MAALIMTQSPMSNQYENCCILEVRCFAVVIPRRQIGTFLWQKCQKSLESSSKSPPCVKTVQVIVTSLTFPIVTSQCFMIIIVFLLLQKERELGRRYIGIRDLSKVQRVHSVLGRLSEELEVNDCSQNGQLHQNNDAQE